MELLNFSDKEESTELDVDNWVIKKPEVEKAVKTLKNNKAPGLDNIQAELLKNGGAMLTERFTGVCNVCWECPGGLEKKECS